MITLFGIKQCDTCRKALAWLDARGADYTWQDVRETPLSARQIDGWIDAIDAWSLLVNKRSTTWREMTPAAREALNSDTVVAQLLQTPTLIKRPVLVHDKGVEIGFSEKKYTALADD